MSFYASSTCSADPGFLSVGYSNSDLEFKIVTVSKIEVGNLAWFGVCA